MNDEPDPVMLRKMERALRTLPRRQREIFLAVRLDDLSYAEIAQRTGLSIRDVERELTKALANFSRRMDQAPRRWWPWR